MTHEEAKQVFLDRGFVNGIFDGDKWRQSIVVISEWLQSNSEGDAISREAVLECLKATNLKEFDWIIDAREQVKSLPSIQPKAKVGHWIGDNKSKWKCSNCGIKVIPHNNTPYCPCCGAKMEDYDET